MPDTETFDSLYSQFLTARAAATDSALTEEENTEASERDDSLIWRMICTPGSCRVHVDMKLTLLEEMLQVGEWADKREFLMLASIRADMQEFDI